MKNITLLFFALLMSALSWQGTAQVVTIGTGTGVQMQPLANYFGYERTADLYLASEINMSGDISVLGWNANAIGSTHPVKIYLATTSNTALTSGYYDNFMSNLNPTLVYSGSIAASSTPGVKSFNLDSPFSYNGTDNLVVIVENNYGGSGIETNNATKVTFTSGQTNRHMFWRRDTNPPGNVTTPTLNGNRSNVRLDFSPPAPICSGTPVGGSASINPPSGGGDGVPVTLSAIGYTTGFLGITYLWEYRFNNEPWAPFGTASATYADANAIITGTIGSILSVRLNVTCTNSSITSYSSEATYTIVPAYCKPSYTSTSDYLSSVSSSGAITNISYSTSSQPTNGYSDQTAQAFEAYETLTFDINTTYVGGGNGVKVWVDWNNDFTFDAEEEVAYQAGLPAQKTLSVTVPAGTPMGDYRMRVRGVYGSTANPLPCGSTSFGSAIDFNLTISAPPSCLAPSGLTATNISDSSADLAWVPSGNEGEWEVVYGPSGFDPETEGITASGLMSPSTTLTSLNSNTLYTYYVKAVCGQGDESGLAGPVSFKTACGAMTEMFENFDSYATGSIVPDCWVRMTPATSSGSMSISSVSPASGTRNIYQYASATSNAVIVVLPEFSNINAGTHWLRFKARVSSGAPGTLMVGYVTDVSDYSSFTVIENLSITNTSYATDSEYTVAVPSSVPANARIAIKNTNDAKSYYWDDIHWEVAPSCLPVTNMENTAVTRNSVDIAWNTGGSETAWNISWGTPGYTPGDGNQIDTGSSSSTTFHIPGLTADTHYDVYVQADCGGNDESTWSGPLAVFTGYCAATSTSNSGDYLSLISSDGAVMNISYTGTSSSGGYVNKTSETFMAYEGQVFDINTKYVGGNHKIKVWADWDNDLVFEDDENTELVINVHHDTNSTGLKTHSFTVPAGTPNGEYRVRVRGMYSFSPTTGPDPCGSVTYGTSVDFKLTIVDPPSCPAPTNLAVSGITEDSAGVTWTAGSNQTEWEVLYGPANFDPNGTAGTSIPVSNIPETTLNGLSASTFYDVYVREICGVDDESAWVGPVQFMTECGAGTIPFNEGFEGGYTDGASLAGCWSQSGTEWLTRTQPGTYGRDSRTGSGYIALIYGSDDWIFYPLDLTGGTTYELSFYARQDASSGAQVMASFGTEGSVAGMTTVILPSTEVTSSTYEEFSGNFTPTSNGVYYIGIKGTTTYTPWYLTIDDISVIEAPSAGYVYENGQWTPSDPSGVALDTDNITVINGSTSLTADTDVNNLTIQTGATLNITNVLNLYGDLTIDGDLVFVSNANGNGELGFVAATSAISGDATVQRYMKAKRSYRMVSSAVTTSSSVHANWQEGAATNTHNPAPGFGTHITGSTIDQQNGFDGTATGNPSMFTVDLAAQAFVAVSNTNVNTLNAGTPYLLFVRGDRGTDLGNNLAAGETVLRAKGSLHTGTDPQPFATVASGAFAMFGNPYQSAVNINSVFANSTNVNAGHYYVYDPSLGSHGSYVTVALPAGTNTASSDANQFLQPGQGAQFATAASGASSIVFNEADKAPGNFTSTSANDNRLSSDNMLTVQLYTTENFGNGGPTHDSFGIIFGDGLDNEVTHADALKPMNFYENLARNHNGTFLSIERREMPVAAEVYPLYSSGYNYMDYTLKMRVDGLDETILYLDDHFTGTSTLIEGGETAYTFSVDTDNELSIATDRFSIRTEARLGVDNNGLLAGVRLFPNPLNDNTFYINAPKLNGEQISVSITDLSGRQIFESMLDCRANTVTVSVNENLASGVYMVTLRHGGEESTYRLMKK